MKFKVKKDWNIASQEGVISLKVGDYCSREQLEYIRGIKESSDEVFLGAIEPYIQDGFLEIEKEPEVEAKKAKAKEPEVEAKK